MNTNSQSPHDASTKAHDQVHAADVGLEDAAREAAFRDATSHPPETSSPRDLEGKLADAEARVLRAQADFDNFRKRVRREQEEERKFAALPLIQDLLPVLDNFDRALATDTSDAGAGFKSGIQMVATLLRSVLQQHHCQPILAEGTTFNPMSHEAIGKEVTDQVPAGTIVKVERVGYRLHDRVIRPACVVVAEGASGATHHPH